MIVQKVEEVYKVVLRGCKDYNELLQLLKDSNAPKERVAFIDYMSNIFYVDDDFFALLALVQRNLLSYKENTVQEVLLHIFEKIHSDYIDFLI